MPLVKRAQEMMEVIGRISSVTTILLEPCTIGLE